MKKVEDTLKEMRDCIGIQAPIVFFEKMVEVFGILFNEIDGLKKDLKLAKQQSALTIAWEPKLAANMIAKQIEILRQDKEVYFNELMEFKKAYADGIVTKDYKTFVEFWELTLGYHPFLDC